VKTKDKMAYIGSLVKEARESKGISQIALCKGLCSRAMLVRLEQGVNNPEKILVDAFFQRLGLSINKFGMVYVKNEYESFELRRVIINAILDGDVEWAGKQIILYERNYEQTSCKKLHKQFIDIAKIIMEKVSNKKHDNEIEEMIRKVLCLTCPDFHEEEIMSYLLYDKEITLILLLAENFHHQGRKEEAIRLYFLLLRYMDNNVSDEEELVRLYPKTALLLSEILLEEERYEELHICRHAIQILKENHKICFLEELLSISLAGWEAEGSTRYLENREYYQTAINGLKELQENETDRKRDKLLLSEPVSQGWLIGDQISSLRKICGLSQEDLGICDPASISRIERGRKPTDNHYLEIMEKIGRVGMLYYPFILSEKYALHVARGNFTRYIARKDYTNADKVLLSLEAGLDKSEPINQQYLLRSRALVDNGKGLLSREAMLDKIMDAIRITAPVNVEYRKGGTMFGTMVSEETLIGYLESWPLTQTETIIWNNIANAKGDLGNIEEKIQILSMIKKNYEKNPVSLYHNAKGYLITLNNLVNELESVDADDEAIRYCEEGIRICLVSGDGYVLVDLLFTKAFCLYKVEKDEKFCFKLLRVAFSIAYILDYKAMCNLIKKYCDETFQKDTL